MDYPLSLPAPIGDDDLLELAIANEPLRFERDAAGRLIVSPPTGGETGRRTAEVNRQLGNWNIDGGHGVVFDSSGGFRLPDTSIRSPDSAWMSAKAWTALSLPNRAGIVPAAPELAIEVISRSHDAADGREKLAQYLANGVLVALMLDPFRRVAEVLERANSAPVSQIGDRLTIAKELLDGATFDLVLDLARIFSP